MGGRTLQREKCESHVLGSFFKISSSFVWRCHLLILGNTCSVMRRGGAGRPTPTRRISHHLLGRPPGCYFASAATKNKALLCCSFAATSGAYSCSGLRHDFWNAWQWTSSQHLYPIYQHLISHSFFTTLSQNASHQPPRDAAPRLTRSETSKCTDIQWHDYLMHPDLKVYGHSVTWLSNASRPQSVRTFSDMTI
jgi:hypothetical protein